MNSYKPKEISKNPSSKEIFGYFSIVASSTIELCSGNYKKSLEIVSPLSLDHLPIFSRAVGGLMSLFLVCSQAYFMQEQYKESARLSELALLFSQKNKKYFASAVI